MIFKNDKAWKSIWKWWWIIDHFIFTKIVYRFLDTIKIRIRPEIVALFNFSLVCAFAYNLSTWNYELSIIWASIYIFYPLLDILDGALARYHSMKNLYWVYLDSIIDILSETIVLLWLCLYFWLSWLYLIIVFLPLATSYTLLQEKTLCNKTEKQLNVLDYLPNRYASIPVNLKNFLVIFSRNDARKIIIRLWLFFNIWILIYLYFTVLYSWAIINSIKNMIITSKPIQ